MTTAIKNWNEWLKDNDLSVNFRDRLDFMDQIEPNKRYYATIPEVRGVQIGERYIKIEHGNGATPAAAEENLRDLLEGETVVLDASEQTLKVPHFS